MSNANLSPTAQIWRSYKLLARLAAANRWPYISTMTIEVVQIRSYADAGLVTASFLDATSWISTEMATVTALTPKGRATVALLPASCGG